MKKCVICNFPLKSFLYGDNGIYHCDCYRCGKYNISEEAFSDYDGFITNEIQAANLSGWIYENQNELITTERLQRLSKLITPGVDEKSNNILLYLSKIYPIPGQQLPDIYRQIKSLTDQFEDEELQPHQIEFAEKFLPLFAIAHTSSLDEIYYLLFDYLFHEQDYLNLDGIEKITPRDRKSVV